jgi:hypothetical protein
MTTHPPIDFSQLTIDPVRLARALTLSVEPFEGHDPETGEVVPQPGCYSVTPVGPEAEKLGVFAYWVDLYSHDIPRCTCGDHIFRSVICKHMLACLLHENHPLVVSALKDLTAALHRRLQESVQQSRKPSNNRSLAPSR